VNTTFNLSQKPDPLQGFLGVFERSKDVRVWALRAQPGTGAPNRKWITDVCTYAPARACSTSRR
jgi:hypothetical protein